MQKVLILGSGGSGKSSLAQALGQVLNLEVIHLDTHFWKAGWVEPAGDEWQQTVAILLERDGWIMDGNYSSTLDQRLAIADTVIFLDQTWIVLRSPAEVCQFLSFCDRMSGGDDE